MKIQERPLIINIMAFIFICSLCYVVYWQTGLLYSGFNMFINDHLMVSMQQDIQQFGFYSTLVKWINHDYNIGRFQPFYYIQNILLTQAFGLNAKLWFGYTCLLASITVFCLFWFARLIGISLLVACIFPALAFVGLQAIMWSQPSYPQVVGTFLLAITMPLAVITTKVTTRKWNILLNTLFILLVFLTSLSKESYIIFIPALIAIRIWAYTQSNDTSLLKTIQNTIKVNAILFGMMIVELLYIFLVIGADGMGYAGIQEETFQLAKISDTIFTFFDNSYFELVGVAFIISLIVLMWQKKSILIFFKQLLPVITIAFLIISPQILLYTKSGIHGYYSIPATIGSALLIMYFIHLLSDYSKAVAYFLITISMVLVLANFPDVSKSYSIAAQSNYHINKLLEETQRCTPNREAILVVLNPRLRYEASLSLRKVLDYVYDRQNLVVATYGIEGTDFYSDTYKDAEKSWSFLDPQAVAHEYGDRTISTFTQKQKISAVIVFDGLDKEFFATSQSWFKQNRFTKSEFPINFASANLYCKN